MNKYIISFSAKSIKGVFMMLGLAMLLGACQENINDDNYAIKKELTMTDRLAEDPELSGIKAIFDRVRLGNSSNASSLTSVLSARGNYTVFAPTNAALRSYVYSLTGSEDISSLSDEQAQLVAYNCIIDNGDNGAYETPDFPVKGAFALPNLNDRLLTSQQEEETQDYIINGTSRLTSENIEVSNGVLHIVDAVISLSSNTVAEMIQDAPNMKVMGRLLSETTWADSLIVDRDVDYENKEHVELMPRSLLAVYRDFIVPQKRYLGFTAFVETDDVYESELGITLQKDAEGNITNWDDLLTALRAKAEAVYGTQDADNLTSPENAINRFVAYHFVEGKMAYNRFVTHYNEVGYKFGSDAKNPQTTNYTVDVWEYYRTMGKYHDLVKITQVPTGDHEIYLNRVSRYNDGFDGDYSEVSTIAHTPGVGLNVLVDADNGEYDNNALNGYYYPIHGLLLKTNEVSDALGGERIRFDLTAALPEMQSNSLKSSDYHYFEHGFFDGITNESSNTHITYLSAAWGGGANWTDFQGDEFLFGGLFDFVLRLPPVPKTGTYEIRMGISQNPLRGMAQLYFGEDPYRLTPTGLPLDLRQSVDPSNNPQLNWQGERDDSKLDDETRIENDKNLRNQSYMRAPMYFTASDGSGEKLARYLPNGYDYCVVRRIVGIQYMEAHKTYYIRFKSALKKLDAQFFVDYFEYCPSIIYNGAEAENPW